MLLPSTEPIPDGQAITNYGFGNRCVICGSFFDECGVCANFHEYGEIYYYPPGEEPNPQKFPSKSANLINCQKIQNNICNSRFSDDENICQNGHVIGRGYYKR